LNATQIIFCSAIETDYTMKLFTAYPLFFHLLQVTEAYWPPGKELPANITTSGEKIIDGEPVDPKDRYPFQVSLTTRRGSHYCGGFLIAPDWVLSAAHCAGERNGRVQIGRWDISDNSEDYEDFKVDYELVHPNYNDRTLSNDYMLLKLEETSQYPPVSIDDGSQLLPAGTDVTVMGWGNTRDSFFNGRPSDILLEVEVDIVSNAECNSDYGGDVFENMICAARPGKDACQGDSGGPLVVRGADHTEDVVVGIVSWGIGCADSRYPGVYARISSGYDWISSNVDLGPGPVGCTDSPTPFSAANGQKGCEFIAANTNYCDLTQVNVKSHCPDTCSACAEYECADSQAEFQFNGNDIICSAIPANLLTQACGVDDISKTCRATCNYCP